MWGKLCLAVIQEIFPFWFFLPVKFITILIWFFFIKHGCNKCLWEIHIRIKCLKIKKYNCASKKWFQINLWIINDTFQLEVWFPAKEAFRKKMQKYSQIFVHISPTFPQNFAMSGKTFRSLKPLHPIIRCHVWFTSLSKISLKRSFRKILAKILHGVETVFCLFDKFKTNNLHFIRFRIIYHSYFAKISHLFTKQIEVKFLRNRICSHFLRANEMLKNEKFCKQFTHITNV